MKYNQKLLYLNMPLFQYSINFNIYFLEYIEIHAIGCKTFSLEAVNTDSQRFLNSVKNLSNDHKSAWASIQTQLVFLNDGWLGSVTDQGT